MQTNTKLFKSFSLLLFFIAGIYLVGVGFYLNWTYWWYDMVLHFLSGGAVGLASLWVIKKFFNFSFWSKYRIVVWTLVSVFAVGVLWEIFELYVDFTTVEDGMKYVFDTYSDLVLDIFGGVLAIIYGFKLKDE